MASTHYSFNCGVDCIQYSVLSIIWCGSMTLSESERKERLRREGWNASSRLKNALSRMKKAEDLKDSG